MQKELFYVAVSCGRETVVVIASDKDQLRESVSRLPARPRVFRPGKWSRT